MLPCLWQTAENIVRKVLLLSCIVGSPFLFLILRWGWKVKEEGVIGYVVRTICLETDFCCNSFVASLSEGRRIFFGEFIACREF